MQNTITHTWNVWQKFVTTSPSTRSSHLYNPTLPLPWDMSLQIVLILRLSARRNIRTEDIVSTFSDDCILCRLTALSAAMESGNMPSASTKNEFTQLRSIRTLSIDPNMGDRPPGSYTREMISTSLPSTFLQLGIHPLVRTMVYRQIWPQQFRNCILKLLIAYSNLVLWSEVLGYWYSNISIAFVLHTCSIFQGAQKIRKSFTKR